jgi:lysozyme
MSNATRLTGAAGAVTAIGILTIALVGGFEGLRLVAYKDVVGVWTACYGETEGIKPGMKFTKEQCNVMFLEGLTRHEKGMRSCLNDPDGIPDKVYVAALSLTYNVGVGGFCKSTVARRLNNLDYRGACNALLAWNKAGGHVISGLVKRRQRERTLCLDGLK